MGRMKVTQYRNIKKYSSDKIAVYRIPIESFPFHVTNVYLVIGKRPFLVDTGLENENSRKDLAEGFRIIQSEFREAVGLEDVSDIVITHGHIDHFGMVGHKQLIGKNIYIHEKYSEIIRNYDTRTDYMLERIDNFLITTGMSDALREGIIGLYRLDKERFKPKNMNHHVIDVHDNDEIIDGHKVHYTPGHSPGAICLEVGDFLVPRLISSVRDFGNLTLKNEDAFRQSWPEVLCG